jgi:hypothetical protein
MNTAQIAGTIIGIAAVGTVAAVLIEGRIRDHLRIPWLVSDETCFLVSDKDWQAVLGCVPIAYRSRPLLGSWGLTFIIWLLLRLLGLWLPIYKHIRKNPVLIFHEEAAAFDADSILHFLQQFNPTRLFIIGDTPTELDALLVAPPPHGAGLTTGTIYRVYPKDFPDFWWSFDKVVVVDPGEYRGALVAATYASLEASPIFFIDESNLGDHQVCLNGRKVYVIGGIDGSVSTYIDAHASSRVNYSVQALTYRYLSRTRTRKLVLADPNDLDDKIAQNFQPEKSAAAIAEVFTNGSLPAPVIAAGRHQVLLAPDFDDPDHDDFDDHIENFIDEGNMRPKYLTIIGSPLSIPQSIEADPSTAWGHRLELDGRHYGSIHQDLAYVDLATGRIYGISTSDVSSNIARSLFYSHLPRNRDALVLPREDHQSGIDDGTDEGDLEDYYRLNYWTAAVDAKFLNTTFYSGHTEIQNNLATLRDEYDESHLIFFADHGGSTSFTGVMHTTYFEDNEVYLMCPNVIDLACSTGQFDKVGNLTKTRLFNVQSIRRGAIVQISAVSVSYWHQMFDEQLDNMYLNRVSAGEAFRRAKNAEYDRNAPNFHTVYQGDPWYFLMGDPAFVPKYW